MVPSTSMAVPLVGKTPCTIPSLACQLTAGGVDPGETEGPTPSPHPHNFGREALTNLHAHHKFLLVICIWCDVMRQLLYCNQEWGLYYNCSPIFFGTWDRTANLAPRARPGDATHTEPPLSVWTPTHDLYSTTDIFPTFSSLNMFEDWHIQWFWELLTTFVAQCSLHKTVFAVFTKTETRICSLRCVVFSTRRHPLQARWSSCVISSITS